MSMVVIWSCRLTGDKGCRLTSLKGVHRCGLALIDVVESTRQPPAGLILVNIVY